MAAANRARKLLEIEIKFSFNRAILPLVRANSGSPPFASLKFKGHSVFNDTYFDSPIRQLRSGPSPIWLRKRNSSWEAKITSPSTHGNFDRAAFEEITDVPAIHQLVKARLQDEKCPGAEANFGLGVYCDITTYRDEYFADDKFSIVFDTTDFGHDVGEVEVTGNEGELEKAQRQIDEFMKKYQWVFGSGGGVKPKGKMSAYFEKFGQR